MRTRLQFARSILLSALMLAGCRTTARCDRGSTIALRQADEYGRVELLRDQWGVPHVFARSDAGAMYGLGFATAQDRAFQMYYNLRIIQGRLAETIGDVKPEPWTLADCIASWWRMGLFLSGDGLNELTAYYEIKNGVRHVRQFAPTDNAGVPPGVPIRDDASVIQRGDVSDAWVQEVLNYAAAHGLTRKVDTTPRTQRPGPRFSHAWVVGGKRTTTGSAVLVGDPQTPVRNPSLWYEFHISGRTFNARIAADPNAKLTQEEADYVNLMPHPAPLSRQAVERVEVSRTTLAPQAQP